LGCPVTSHVTGHVTQISWLHLGETQVHWAGYGNEGDAPLYRRS